jgi:hypothetical protein
MRRFIPFFALWLSLLVGAPSALAGAATGYDPADRPDVGDPDIRSTTRQIFDRGGVRYLMVDLAAYETLSDWWRVDVALDSRGGPAADYRMSFANFDTGGTECKIWKIHHHDRAVDGRFRQSGVTASCRVEAADVRSSKPNRWYLRSPSMHASRVDRAPDSGWYS